MNTPNDTPKKDITLETIYEAIKYLTERINVIESVVNTLTRKSSSNMLNELYHEIRIKRRMNIKQVVDFCGCSRQYALELVKKLGKRVNFELRKGSAKKRMQSIIFYKKEEEERHFKFIKGLLEKNNGAVYFEELKDTLKISDVSKIRDLVERFKDTNPNKYYIKEVENPIKPSYLRTSSINKREPKKVYM